MRLDFTKMHGLGNDFVMIDNMDGSIHLDPQDVVRICDRHFGVGADGVILVERSSNGADGFMNYINSDGTYAEMCGNGVRCFAKFLVDNGYVPEECDSLSAETRAGIKNIVFTKDADGKLIEATVDMGEPILDPEGIPVNLDANSVSSEGLTFAGDAEVTSPWGSYSFTCVSMGNPHAVCFIDDIDALPDDVFTDPEKKSLDTLNLDLIGAFYESNPVFPQKANIEFAIVEDDHISMRVFERGCGETLACGTGACATSVASTLTSRSGRANRIELKGGPLMIDWADDDHVHMTGPAVESFKGCLDI